MQRAAIALLAVLALLAAGRTSPAGAELPPVSSPTPTVSVPAASSDLSSVVQRYVDAIGGRELLGKIHSSIIVYSVKLMGRELLVTTTTKNPVYFLQVTRIRGTSGQLSVGFDGKTAWLQQANGVVHVMTGQDRAELISDAVGANDSEIFTDRWPTTVTLKPSENVNGKTYAVLSIKAKGGISHDIFLDPQTYQPAIERTATTAVTSVTVVDTFDKGPLGELLPRVTTTTRSDGFPPTTASLRSIDDNANVSNSIFAPPLGKGSETI